MSEREFDAIVVGGGFYGTAIASYLVLTRGLARVALLEREAGLLLRASANNQARIHNGYHYPRSFTTAYRSRVNFPRFLRDYADACRRDFTSLYAIARNGSKVSARQFERFCTLAGAPLRPATAELRSLFTPRSVEAVYTVEEWAFDTTALARKATADLASLGVQVWLDTIAQQVQRDGEGLQVLARAPDGTRQVRAPLVFNCTYSGLNTLGERVSPLKHELAELALVEPPAAMRGLAFTVMDGPFFSMMPFPSRGLSTLSHVRFTPHHSWSDVDSRDPRSEASEGGRASRFDRMRRDAARFIPAISAAVYQGSLFETKTILPRNEVDDGRPILFERSQNLPGLYSVLGGKIDNIYDVIERLDREPMAGKT